MNYLTPSRFIGKSFLWAFVVLIVLITGPRYWAESAGLSKALANGLYRTAAFIPLFIQLLTGCILNRMWVASETRADQPVKYWWLCVACLIFGLMVALGTNPERMR
jgi:hypothetical protein